MDHHVFIESEVQDEPVTVSIFGNMAQPRFGPPLYRVMGNILPIQEYQAAFGLYEPREGVDQLSLTVAVDAAEPQDFAPTNLQG